MYFTKSSCVLVLCLIFAYNLSSESPTREKLELIFEKKEKHKFLCIYDEDVCTRGEQFCSGRTKSCKKLFTGNITNDNIKFCLDVVRGNDTQTEAGLYDGCFYFLGSSASKNDTVFECATTIKDNVTDTPTNRQEPGREFCATGQECQAGNERCNATTKTCDVVFPQNATNEDKWLQCLQNLAKEPDRYDVVCLYVLGRRSTGCISGEAPTTPGLVLGLGLGLGISLGIVIILITVILIILYRKKLICHRVNNQPVNVQGNQELPEIHQNIHNENQDQNEDPDEDQDAASPDEQLLEQPMDLE